MNISNGYSFDKKVSFTGHKTYLDNTGFPAQKFYFPFDSKKFSVQVELHKVEKDNKGNYTVREGSQPVDVQELDPRAKAIDYDTESLDDKFGDDSAFAYRFKVVNNKTKESKYAFDPGLVANMLDETGGFINKPDNKFTLVFKDRALINRPGKFELVLPDMFYPGAEKADNGVSDSEALRASRLTKINYESRKDALNSVRNHANQLGGNFWGIIHKLDDLEEEGYTSLVGTPFTDDPVTSHKYWTKNAFQISSELGDDESFKTFQQEMFKHGINWVADAALVNEGLEGLHFSSLLKWGEESPNYYMFKAPGAADGSLTLGVLPENSKHARFKLVNSPVNLDGSNNLKNFNPLKPTYVQFYDDRLATDKQLKSGEKFDKYDKTTPDNSLEITSNDDVVAPYNFALKPEDIKTSIKKFYDNGGDKSEVQSYAAMKEILTLPKFSIAERTKAAGFETWDGNVDISKLNFYIGAKDKEAIANLPIEKRAEAEELMKSSVAGVKDYAVQSGKYWTKKTADTQIAYVANYLKNLPSDSSEVLKLINNGVKTKQLPKSVKDEVSLDVIENVLDGNYNLPRLAKFESRDEYTLKNLLEVPLESLPIADSTLTALTTPYIATKASTDSEVGASRFELYSKGNPNLPEKFRKVHSQADNLYAKNLASFANEILKGINLPLYDNGDAVSDLGIYVISQVMPEITKFAMIKALDPNANIKLVGNTISYENYNSDNTSLEALGIKASNPEEEASMLVDRLKQGVSSISESDKKALIAVLNNQLKGVSAESYMLADAIIDRTESGLGWRIDAAKDVSSIDSVRDGSDTFEQAWENVIDFWKTYTSAVREINPHVYTTAEITDIPDLYNLEKARGENRVGRFNSPTDAETKFILDTGINNIANYTYFFSSLQRMFARDPENGTQHEDFDGGVETLRKNLITGWNGNAGFIYQLPLDGVLHSYNFVGNHDKPRLIHLLALDLGLFYSDFSKSEDKERAKKVLGIQAANDDIDFEKISAPAIAVGEKYRKIIDKLSLSDKEKEIAKKAIANLASGKYKGKTFDPDAFGMRPFDKTKQYVLDEAKSIAVKSNIESTVFTDDAKAKQVGDELLKQISEPACSKTYSIYKMLITAPGNPTDFAGDKIGMSGYETKAKNYKQQNRNTIPWEYVDSKDDKYLQFVADFNNKMNEILALRNDPNLSALNSGTPVSLKVNNGIYPVLRYDDSGSIVLSLYTNDGATLDTDMTRNGMETDGPLYLESDGYVKEGLPAGLDEGTVFVNARDKNLKYEVYSGDDGKYHLKSLNDPDGKIKVEPEDFNTLVMYKEQPNIVE